MFAVCCLVMPSLFDLGHCKNLQELNVSDCQSFTVSMRVYSIVVYVGPDPSPWRASG